MTIKEIETITGLPRANVRFYEAQGLIHPSRGDNGYRDYSQDDLAVLEKIKLLRQLDCSLEEIRALQTGELSLDYLLERRLTELMKHQSDTEQAIRLCRQLQADRVDWMGLDPGRYPLSPDICPPEEVSDLRFSCPWRRFWARTVDFGLCFFLWNAALALMFRANILSRTGLENCFHTFVAMGLELAMETLCLHFLGTTPGKWLMGLRLTRSDGSFFSLPDACQRTLGVMVKGEGFRLPLVGGITNILSYLRCRRGVEQPWALEDEAWSDGTNGKVPFWEQKGHALRVAGLVGVYLAFIGLTMAVELFAACPRYHGPLTPQQLADNYNHLSFFDAAPESPAYRLQADGSWVQTAPNAFVFNVFGGDPVPISIQSQDGLVTGISFSLNTQDEDSIPAIPLLKIDYLLHALLGHRSFLSSSPATQVLRELNQAENGHYTWEVDGWRVTYDLEAQGYIRADDLLFPKDGQTQSFQLSFSIQAL